MQGQGTVRREGKSSDARLEWNGGEDGLQQSKGGHVVPPTATTVLYLNYSTESARCDKSFTLRTVSSFLKFRTYELQGVTDNVSTRQTVFYVET